MHSTLPFQHTPTCREQVWPLDPALPGPWDTRLPVFLPLPMLAKNIPSKSHHPPPLGPCGLRGCSGFISGTGGQLGSPGQETGEGYIRIYRTRSMRQPLSVCSLFRSPPRIHGVSY